jgi:hypothetical protein
MANIDTFLSRAIRDNNKLGPKFIGPFKITAMPNASAATLELPPGYRQHPTINTSNLRKFIFDEFKRNVPPEPTINVQTNEVEYEVDYIVDEKEQITGKGRARKSTTYFLVVWKGHDVAEATWEPLANLENAPEKIREFRDRQNNE